MLACTVRGAAVGGDRGGEGEQDPLADRTGDLRPGRGQQDGELVAADAGDQVTGADAALEPLGDGEQHLVTGGVPAAVVDVLEAVEVDEQQAHPGAVAEQPVGALLQLGAVGDAGEGVAEDLVLVEPPGGQVGQARGEHEGGVDAGPQPRVVHAGVAEHGVRVEGADDAVVQRDDEQRDAEGHPVLVQRDDADHHEEDEVRLGDPGPQVHERGGGGHQAQRGGRRPGGPTQRGHRGRQQRGADGDEHDDGRQLALPPRPAQQQQAEGRQQGEPHDDAVPALPDGLGQHPARGQQRGHPRTKTVDHAFSIDRLRTLL